MHRSRALRFRVRLGRMHVDFKLLSRDHCRSVSVEDAIVDPRLARSVAPMHWLEALRSPSKRLPTGYFTESPVFVAHPDTVAASASSAAGSAAPKGQKPNAIRAGPVVMYIVGQPAPVVLTMDFVDENLWPGMNGAEDCDVRIGRDAVEQCTLFSELRPGGLLSDKSTSELRKQGMQCKLAESPLVIPPHLRMKTMFIEEIQRGPTHKEFVGNNPRVGQPWRFSQHSKHFRQGIWREITRRNEMHEGLHAHSSWQKSPQQSVPGMRPMAPSP